MSVNIEGVLEVFKLQDTLNVYELIFIAIEMAKEVIITPDLKRFFHLLKVPQHTCSSLVGISEQLPQTQRSLSVFFISDSVDWWANRFSLGLPTGSSLKGSRPSQSQGRAIIICRSSIERWYQVWNVLPSNERNSQMCMWGGKRHQQTNCMQYCQTGYSIIKHCWPARHQLSSFESLTGAEPRYQPENC